ncbi:MAG TPA: MarC family protein [Candidatus Polarisedimenticolia bacterium]|nr:MarC family protein [Candidatus Polarisedimenticolia bacterium]
MAGVVQFGLACFFAIFPIVNPFSAAALLVALTPGDTQRRRVEQARRAVSFMTGILLVSFFAGTAILSFFSISGPALVIAAGVLVCRSGWRAITGADRLTPAQREEGVAKVDISLTPLGMPMLAGPGTISVVIGLSADSPGVWRSAAAVAAMVAVAAASYLVLAAAPLVVRWLGETGQAAVSKVMGLIILCVGIQFLLNGLSAVAPRFFQAAPAAIP